MHPVPPTATVHLHNTYYYPFWIQIEVLFSVKVFLDRPPSLLGMKVPLHAAESAVVLMSV